VPSVFSALRTDATRSLARWAMLPVMRIWAATAHEKMLDVPRPLDSPTVEIAGPDPDHVLLFGSGASVGWGVFSHELALPGTLGRQLTARTGRGVTIDVVPNTRTTISSAIDELAQIELWRYDAIVLTIGGNDAFALTSPRAWQHGVLALIDYLHGHSSRITNLILVGTQPVRNIPGFDTPLGRVAAWHARTLNQLTARICAESGQATFVPLPPAPRSSTVRFRTANDYEPWGALLAGCLADLLDGQE
jgi:lysophospholipase L1-like esterase